MSDLDSNQPSRSEELLADAKRYLVEAGEEWLDNASESPPSHVYTAIAAIVGYQVIRWIV